MESNTLLANLETANPTAFCHVINDRNITKKATNGILSSRHLGLIFTIPLVDRLKRVDMRMRAFKVPPQEVIHL